MTLLASSMQRIIRSYISIYVIKDHNLVYSPLNSSSLGSLTSSARWLMATSCSYSWLTIAINCLLVSGGASALCTYGVAMVVLVLGSAILITTSQYRFAKLGRLIYYAVLTSYSKYRP